MSSRTTSKPAGGNAAQQQQQINEQIKKGSATALQHPQKVHNAAHVLSFLEGDSGTTVTPVTLYATTPAPSPPRTRPPAVVTASTETVVLSHDFVIPRIVVSAEGDIPIKDEPPSNFHDAAFEAVNQSVQISNSIPHKELGANGPFEDSSELFIEFDGVVAAEGVQAASCCSVSAAEVVNFFLRGDPPAESKITKGQAAGAASLVCSQNIEQCSTALSSRLSSCTAGAHRVCHKENHEEKTVLNRRGVPSPGVTNCSTAGAAVVESNVESSGLLAALVPDVNKISGAVLAGADKGNAANTKEASSTNSEESVILVSPAGERVDESSDGVSEWSILKYAAQCRTSVKQQITQCSASAQQKVTEYSNSLAACVHAHSKNCPTQGNLIQNGSSSPEAGVEEIERQETALTNLIATTNRNENNWDCMSDYVDGASHYVKKLTVAAMNACSGSSSYIIPSYSRVSACTLTDCTLSDCKRLPLACAYSAHQRSEVSSAENEVTEGCFVQRGSTCCDFGKEYTSSLLKVVNSCFVHLHEKLEDSGKCSEVAAENLQQEHSVKTDEFCREEPACQQAAAAAATATAWLDERRGCMLTMAEAISRFTGCYVDSAHIKPSKTYHRYKACRVCNGVDFADSPILT